MKLMIKPLGFVLAMARAVRQILPRPVRILLICCSAACVFGQVSASSGLLYGSLATLAYLVLRRAVS